jgi:uncharacterized protein (TIGR03382 family)
MAPAFRTVFVIGVHALALLAAPLHVRAAVPKNVRLSWAVNESPGEAAATARTMTIAWNTPSTADPSTVEFGTSTAYGAVAEGAAIPATGKLGAVHEVTLTDLLPLTVYHYRVGGPGQWSPDYTFQTGPDDAGCTPFRFVAMGDGRSDDNFGPSPKWSPILAEAEEKAPAFVVLTGDQVRAGEAVDQWSNWLDATYGAEPRVPIMPSLGNHDDDSVEGEGALYNQVFALPKNSKTGTEDFYFFTYGDAIFVSLSMVTYDEDGFALQAAWLDEVLTQHPKTWKFVFFHHPIYTGTLGIPNLFELNHPPNERGQNAALVPIFDKHHVDIVFAGHNHHYQRFHPMCCGGGDDMGAPTGDPETGTTYVITGGAGALTYDLSLIGVDLPGLLCLTPNSAKCHGKHHYMVVDILGKDLSVKVWASSAQLLGSDPANIEVIDEFSISKGGAPPNCDPEPPPPVDEDPNEADAAGGVDTNDTSSEDVSLQTDSSADDAAGPDATGGGDTTEADAADATAARPDAASAGDAASNGGDAVSADAKGDAGPPGDTGGSFVPADATAGPPTPSPPGAPGPAAGAGGGSGDGGCSATERGAGPLVIAAGVVLALMQRRRRGL